MAHELEVINGEASMVFVGETPWTQLGTKFENLLTPKEAHDAAKLGFKVAKAPAYASVMTDTGVKMVPIKGRWGVQRTDTHFVFPKTTVGDRFTLVQNDSLRSGMESVIGEVAPCIETAGVLRGGARVWMLAKLDGLMRVGKDDIVDKYLLGTNDHTGRLQYTMALTAVRVVCANTLAMALAQAESIVRIRHSGNISERVKHSAEALGLVNKSFAEMEEKMQFLATKKVKSEAALDAFLTSLGFSTDSESVRENDKVGVIKESFVAGPGANLVSAKGTWWGAVNSITDYVDHHAPQRGKGTAALEARFERTLYGAGARTKEEAFTKALELALKA
jgi:phage/plasmid-like protein (TIGR03299 family)